MLLLGYRDSNEKRHEIAKIATTNNKALCALRADLVSSVNKGTEFLIRHPDGLLGISAASIQDRVAEQEKTLKALDILACPPS